MAGNAPGKDRTSEGAHDALRSLVRLLARSAAREAHEGKCSHPVEEGAGSPAARGEDEGNG